MKLFHRAQAPVQSPEQWRAMWQSMVAEEDRDVPITVDGRTEIAYVRVNHFVLMLQDGLLMDASFFDVCAHFQRAGYHVAWLMRCVQDIDNGYLKAGRKLDGGSRRQWVWKSPTTNFGRWISDNFSATILLQYRQILPGELLHCKENVLQRVTWAESDHDEQMVPGRTVFYTEDLPGTPEELLRWLQGTTLGSLR